MRILKSWAGLKADDRGSSAAIGNFDGVHLGHQAVIRLAGDEARRRGVPLGIVTFEPHPRQYFAPETPPFRLTNSETRANRLARLGVDRLYELPFDGRLASLSAEAFVAEVLGSGLGLSHAVVGTDFRFGRGRAGTVDDLRRLGEAAGIAVTVADLVGQDGAELSSTAIRQSLSDGDPHRAAAMLGHWHRIDGEVLGGDRRGRDLGYPTANMSIQDLHPPRFGIYAVLVDVLTGPHQGSFGGAASIGVRPMFGVNAPNLETFLFDFTGELYGEHLSVALVEYLRPEAKFDSLDALVRQMDADSERARAVLAAL